MEAGKKPGAHTLDAGGGKPSLVAAFGPHQFPKQEECTGAGVFLQQHSRPHPRTRPPSFPLCR